MPGKQRPRELPFESYVPIRGWPGFRTRDGRTGFDPIDTRAEAAHMQGVFYRNLFTLRLRTRNTFYLVLMFVFGVVPFLVLAFATIGVLTTSPSPALPLLLYPSFFTIVTGALTLNFILSLIDIVQARSNQSEGEAESAQDARKNPKKRRQ